MTSYSFEYLLFLMAFLTMITDGKIDTSEISLTKNFYNERVTQEDMQYEMLANELLKQVNQYGTGIYDTYFTTITELDLSEKEKEDLIEFAIKTAASDGTVTAAEKDLIFQLKKELSIDDKTFKKLSTPYFSYETISEKSKEDYLKSVQLPKFDLFE